MTRRLFNPALRLTFAQAPVGSYDALTSEETTVTGLRVQFNATKSLDSTPNSCTATVYNLSKQSRAELQRPRVKVRLEAGYEGGSLERIFSGDLFYSDPQPQGVDKATKLLISDGGRAHKHARVSRSFKAGTDARTAFKEVAASMGLRVPKSIDDAEGMLTQFASGITLSGPSHEEMTRIVKAAGFDTWSMQDGQVMVLGESEVQGESAILVSVETGMLDSPHFGTPDKDGKPAPLNVRKLIDPGALPQPGSKIYVRSEEVDAFFKVTKVAHIGDTHGSDWHSDMEAIPL